MSSTLRSRCVAVILAAAGMALCQSAVGQARDDLGKREFNANCAVCHGADAKGNGPVVDLLRKRPPDLTQLARQNGGVFPIARLYEVIDGQNVPSHGTRDMPIWGVDYKVKAAEYHMDIAYDPEAYTRARILALLEYINRLQAK